MAQIKPVAVGNDPCPGGGQNLKHGFVSALRAWAEVLNRDGAAIPAYAIGGRECICYVCNRVHHLADIATLELRCEAVHADEADGSLMRCAWAAAHGAKVLDFLDVVGSDFQHFHRFGEKCVNPDLPPTIEVECAPGVPCIDRVQFPPCAT